MKYLRHRYSHILIILSVILVVVIFNILYSGFDFEKVITAIATFLSFIYFAQKQDLEEVALFKELYKTFNDRYDRLNEGLNRIRQGDIQAELTPEEIDLLYNYFNLCGEEYLYCNKRYIYPEVWKAWYNGMKIFYQNERIRKIWKEELKTGSYYGFKIE